MDPPTAPAGFVAASRLAVALFGSGEAALRLLPFLAGLASLLLFLRVARKVLPPTGMPLAMLLFSTGAWLVYFSAEAKPNSLDAALALLLLDLGWNPSGEPPGRGRAALLALAGAAACWLSHPAVFVLAGLGLAMAWPVVRRRRWEAVPVLSCVALAWILSFGAHFALRARDLAGSRFLREHWAAGFAPLPSSAAGAEWWLDLPVRLFRDPGGFLLPGTAVLAVLAALLGVFALRGKGVLAWLLLPAGCALAASAARLWPMEGRMLLFLLPSVLLLAAAGVSRVPGPEWIRILIGAALLLPSLDLAFGPHERPRAREEVRPLVDVLRREARPGDAIYVYYGALPAWRYCTRDGSPAGVEVLTGIRSREDPGRYAADLSRLGRRRRAWVLVSHAYDWGTVDERALILGRLGRAGRPVSVDQAPGAVLGLYDLSR